VVGEGPKRVLGAVSASESMLLGRDQASLLQLLGQSGLQKFLVCLAKWLSVGSWPSLKLPYECNGGSKNAREC